MARLASEALHLLGIRVRPSILAYWERLEVMCIRFLCDPSAQRVPRAPVAHAADQRLQPRARVAPRFQHVCAVVHRASALQHLWRKVFPRGEAATRSVRLQTCVTHDPVSSRAQTYLGLSVGSSLLGLLLSVLVTFPGAQRAAAIIRPG